MKYYRPNYEQTSNYRLGLQAISEHRLEDAVTIFSREPASSSCYGLALANKALAELHVGQYKRAEKTSRLAIEQFQTRCPHFPTWIQAMRNLGEAVSLQDRKNESLAIFREACDLSDKLSSTSPAVADDLALAKAYTLNSWGGGLLQMGDPKAAVHCYIAARDIYRKYPDNRTGCCETLTDLAQAYAETDKITEAGLAIQEARTLARNDPGQTHRINIAGARIGIFGKEESKRVLLKAATDAELTGQFEVAYIRYCIAGFLANKAKDTTWGMEAVRSAEALEVRLSKDSLHPAKLRFYKAAFLEAAGHPKDEIIATLLEGSRLWCDRLPGRLGVRDYQEMTALMHEHFRKLSAVLLREGRNDEAFVAFEIGRARAFTLEVSGNHNHPFLKASPFGATNVDCALLKHIQAGLSEQELVISLAILPPSLVAFVVGRNSLDVCRVDLVKDLSEAKGFREVVRTIASNLENRKGVDCIPAQIVALGREIAGKIATRTIVLLAPHSMLHKIPWRTLFRDAGTSWTQLPFITQFSPLLDPSSPNPDAIFPAGAVALGYGVAGTGPGALNLEDEAEEFAGAFGVHGKIVKGARSENVTTALHGEKTVLLSCHGGIGPTAHGEMFLFDLANGKHTSDDLIQDAVATPCVILSACSSGVYEMAIGDYPVGAAPQFLLAGAKFCVCTRFPIDAYFAKAFFPKFGKVLSDGYSIGRAFANTLQEMESQGYDQWRHLACVELLGRGISDTQ